MNHSSFWTCDGCGLENALRKVDEWRWVEVRIASRQGSEMARGDYELCPTCRLRLAERANPRNWLEKPLLG